MDEETGEVIDEVNALDATTLVSAADFLSAMRDYLDRNWGLPETMTDADTRTLVGLYYTMRQNGLTTARISHLQPAYRST